MSATKSNPSIVTAYYDDMISCVARDITATSRRQAIWSRVGELLGSWQDLDLLAHETALACRRKCLDTAMALVRLHHEYYLFRLYIMRERVGDILCALAGAASRPKSGKEWSEVLSKVGEQHPQIRDSASELHGLLEKHIRMRSIATHKTSLFLALEFSDSGIYEAETLLESFDPTSEQASEIRRVTRAALRKFVREQDHHVRQVLASTMQFAIAIREATVVPQSRRVAESPR